MENCDRGAIGTNLVANQIIQHRRQHYLPVHPAHIRGHPQGRLADKTINKRRLISDVDDIQVL